MRACDTRPMIKAEFGHPSPWTEEEYLALDETTNRIELMDGALWVSPGPNVPHQSILDLLGDALKPAARLAGLKALQGINVHVGPDRILIPDLTVFDPNIRPATTLEAADVRLVVEIVSQSSKTMDRLQKRAMYEAARIPGYLLVEPDLKRYENLTLHYFRSQKDRYVEVATAKQGDTLVADDPFPFVVDTNVLLAF